MGGHRELLLPLVVNQYSNNKTNIPKPPIMGPRTRVISPLFTNPTPTTTTTTPTNSRSSLLLLETAQNLTLKIHATSHTFSTTVPIHEASLLLPVYLSGVITTLETLPPKKSAWARNRDMRIKVVIVAAVAGWYEGGREGGVMEREWLFFGTKEAVLERFPRYLGAVLSLEGDPWAVERVNEEVLEEAEREAERIVGVGRMGRRGVEGGMF